jgi:hypothetical protein
MYEWEARKAQQEYNKRAEESARMWEEEARKAEDNLRRYNENAKRAEERYAEAPRQKITQWGSGAIDNGRKALERIFGKKK